MLLFHSRPSLLTDRVTRSQKYKKLVEALETIEDDVNSSEWAQWGQVAKIVIWGIDEAVTVTTLRFLDVAIGAIVKLHISKENA
jgi:hypothetical protein